MAVSELELHEAACAECGKPISTIPLWLADAKVKFQCEECRQKHPRVPGMADMDLRRGATPSDDSVEIDEHVDEIEEEVEEDAHEETEEYSE
jgi:hypothetical protein